MANDWEMISKIDRMLYRALQDQKDSISEYG